MRNPEPTHLRVGDESVRVERRSRLRQMRLVIDPRCGDAILKLPPRTSLGEGSRFVAGHLDWIAAQRAALPRPRALLPGETLMVEGCTVIITHIPSAARKPVLDGALLTVGGPIDQVPRRVERWLIERAQADLTGRVHAFARLRGHPPPPVTLRDTRSRWGSCSRSGRINLCWRLIGAPAPVRDYVCAHEVAHLAQMNHSPAFWAEVARMNVDIDGSRRWLRRHGSSLLAQGRS